MVLTKINVDELKFAETDFTRSVLEMLPPELKEVVKDHTQKQYLPPKTIKVCVDVSQIIGVSEIEKDTAFCEKYGVSGFYRIWFQNGLSWYIVDDSPENYELLQMFNKFKN